MFPFTVNDSDCDRGLGRVYVTGSNVAGSNASVLLLELVTELVAMFDRNVAVVFVNAAGVRKAADVLSPLAVALPMATEEFV